MRVVLLATLFVLAIASGIAAQVGKQPAAERAGADAPRMDPALGAIRVAADWKQTTFILVAEEGRTVVATPAPVELPHGSAANPPQPPDQAPVGFWMELEPGRYELMAASPGKHLARAAVEVAAGKGVWLNAKLDADQSRIRISEPLDKIGPTLSKEMRMKLRVKFLNHVSAEEAQLDELTGVIETKMVKDLSPAILTIDGNIAKSIGLRGEALEDIPDGSQVWVRGRLHTWLYDNRDDPTPAMNPLQWHIYMDVTEWKATAAPFEKPAAGGTTVPTTQASQEDDWYRYDDPRLSADERKAVRAATDAVLDAERPRPNLDQAFRYWVDKRNGDWVVTVWRVHSFKDGKPQFMPGGHTSVTLDQGYKVKSKVPGR